MLCELGKLHTSPVTGLHWLCVTRCVRPSPIHTRDLNVSQEKHQSLLGSSRSNYCPARGSQLTAPFVPAAPPQHPGHCLQPRVGTSAHLLPHELSLQLSPADAALSSPNWTGICPSLSCSEPEALTELSAAFLFPSTLLRTCCLPKEKTPSPRG